jgi:hypothetical protein
MKAWCFSALYLSFLALGGCFSEGCSRYFSQYSCEYVEEKAEYDVYYWRNLYMENEADNRLIGRTLGLRQCKARATQYARIIGETWNERAYVCVLIKDGAYKEKHRLIG